MKRLVLILLFVTNVICIPNLADLGGHILSHDEKHISNEIDDYYNKEETFNSVSTNIVDKELSEHIHAEGSNMVKRLLKNYESYQNVLVEKNEERKKQDDFKNSVFMDHFHNAAGVVKDYGLSGPVQTNSYKTDTDTEPSDKVDDHDEPDALTDSEEDHSKLVDSNEDINEIINALESTTTTETPEQIVPLPDYPIDTTPQPFESDDEISYSMNVPYSSVMKQESKELEEPQSDLSNADAKNTAENVDDTSQDSQKYDDDTNIGSTEEDTEENTDDTDISTTDMNADDSDIVNADTDRSGRIVNNAGSRRRLSGGGAIRISSGTSGSSLSSYNNDAVRSYISEDLPSFQPRPVYPAPAPFLPGPSQTVHTHVYNGLGDESKVESGGDVHVHVHVDNPTAVNNHEQPLGHDENNLFSDETQNLKEENMQDESGSILGWISDMLG